MIGARAITTLHATVLSLSINQLHFLRFGARALFPPRHSWIPLHRIRIMAAPFIYVPEASAPDAGAYHNPYFTTPKPGQTPFLPPSPFLYPSSPYLGPSDGGGATSDTSKAAFDPNSVLWPENGQQYESAYSASWTPLGGNRPRTNSWAASPASTGSPFLAPKAPGFLHAQSYTAGHKRSAPWGSANAVQRPRGLQTQTHSTRIRIQITPRR